MLKLFTSFTTSFTTFFAIMTFCACGIERSGKANLMIAVAANVQFAMEEIEVAFEKKYQTEIDFIIASSGKLTAQIEQGAPYDLLISANMKYPNILFQKGKAIAPPKVYALGSLVLWTMKEDLILDSALQILSDNKVAKIAIANPINAPYGAEAINAFQFYQLKEKLNSKLVFGESIAQTNQYIFTKNCEVGVTAKSVIMAPEMDGKGVWVDINPESYQSISQGVVITKYGAKHHLELANSFYDFLFELESKEILKKYGYLIPK